MYRALHLLRSATRVGAVKTPSKCYLSTQPSQPREDTSPPQLKVASPIAQNKLSTDSSDGEGKGKKKSKAPRRIAKTLGVLAAVSGLFYWNTRGTVFMPHEGPLPRLLPEPGEGDEAPPIDPDPFARNRFLPRPIFVILRVAHTLCVTAALLADYGLNYSHSELDVAEAEQRAWMAAEGHTYESLGIDDPEIARVKNGYRTFRTLVYKSPRRQQQEQAVHERSATRLLNLAALNGGCYVKLSQHIANLGHGVPLEYSTILSALQDRAPPLPIDRVLGVVADAYNMPLSEAIIHPDGTCGGRLGELFSHIERKPLASASLAQVHRARTKDGQDVVVKIQYGHLRHTLEADLDTVGLCIRIAEAFFRRLSLRTLLAEFSEGLRGELNFVREGQTSEKSAALLHGMGISIPRIRWDLTAPRVLVSEFAEGVPIAATAAVATCGMHPHEVAGNFIDAFTVMIFRTGFLHADPHPGNGIVRPLGARVISRWKENPENYPLGNSSGGRVLPEEVHCARVRFEKPAAPALLSYPASILAATVLLPVRVPLALASAVTDTMGALTSKIVTAFSPPPTDPVAVSAGSLPHGFNTRYSRKHIHTHMQYDHVNDELLYTTTITPVPHDTTFTLAPGPPSSPAVLYLTALTHYLLYPLLAPRASLAPGDWLTPPTPSTPQCRAAAAPLPPQVVLLDHGLYKSLDPRFSRNFAHLFRAFLRRDDVEAKRCAEMLGMGRYWAVLALVLAHRLPGSARAMGAGGFTKEDAMRFRKEFGNMDLQELLSALPADLAFVLKTIALLRSVSAQLQFPRNVRMSLFFSGALKGAHYPTLPAATEDPSPSARVLVHAPYAIPSHGVQRDLSSEKSDQENSGSVRKWLEQVLDAVTGTATVKQAVAQDTPLSTTYWEENGVTPVVPCAPDERYLTLSNGLIVRTGPALSTLTPEQLRRASDPRFATAPVTDVPGLIRLDLRAAPKMSFQERVRLTTEQTILWSAFAAYEWLVAERGPMVVG